MTSSSNNPSTPDRASNWERWIVLSFVAIALSSSWLLEFGLAVPDSHGDAVSPVNWQGPVEQIKADLERLDSETASRELLLWQDFQTRATQVLQENRKTTQVGVYSAVANLVQTGEIGLLITDFARDQVQGGDRATGRVLQCSSDFYLAMEQAGTRTADLVSAFAQELNALQNQHASSAGGIVESFQTRLPQGNYQPMEAALASIPLRVSAEVGGVTVAAVLELVYAKATWKAVQSVTACLAGMLGPQVARAATGVAAALVDGPLPFGDILAVILGVWTVYEVISLPDDLRGVVRDQYQSAADALLVSLESELRGSLEILSGQARENRKQLRASLLAHASR